NTVRSKVLSTPVHIIQDLLAGIYVRQCGPCDDRPGSIHGWNFGRHIDWMPLRSGSHDFTDELLAVPSTINPSSVEEVDAVTQSKFESLKRLYVAPVLPSGGASAHPPRSGANLRNLPTESPKSSITHDRLLLFLRPIAGSARLFRLQVDCDACTASSVRPSPTKHNELEATSTPNASRTLPNRLDRRPPQRSTFHGAR